MSHPLAPPRHNPTADSGLALVETPATALSTLPALFERLAAAPGPFLLFVDDIAFDALDDRARALRSLLDGGVSARPAQVRLAVTSNHRHLHRREAEATARHARDAEDDATALTDRFGLVLGYYGFDQATYLRIVSHYARKAGVDCPPEWLRAEALRFALQRSSRSGRTARQFVDDLAGRLALAAQAGDGRGGG